MNCYQIIDIILKVLALGGIVVAVRQLIMKQQSHLFNVYNDIISMLDEQIVRDARHIVYKFTKSAYTFKNEKDKRTVIFNELKDDNSYTINLKNNAEIVIRSFDKLGFFVRTGRVPLDLIAQFYVTPIMKCWVILYEYIDFLREDRNQIGHMWEFENLVFTILRELKTEKGVWKGIAKHENLKNFKIYPEDKVEKSINLLESLKHIKSWDCGYQPKENLWYLNFYNRLIYKSHLHIDNKRFRA